MGCDQSNKGKIDGNYICQELNSNFLWYPCTNDMNGASSKDDLFVCSSSGWKPKEICGDNIDNDDDGKNDCADEDCVAIPLCVNLIDTDKDTVPNIQDKCPTSSGKVNPSAVYTKGLGIGCPIGDTPSSNGQYNGVVNIADLSWIKTNPPLFWTSILNKDIKNVNAFIKGMVENWS